MYSLIIFKEKISLYNLTLFFYKDFRQLQYVCKNVIGIWNEHDYGQNNGDKYYDFKDMMQDLYLDFVDEPRDSPRRKRAGIYESYILGEEFKTKIILLDVRYHRDSYKDPGAWDMLGKEQWEWLENEIMTSEAPFNLIFSGI
jgi:alkaline phosphatase D